MSRRKNRSRKCRRRREPATARGEREGACAATLSAGKERYLTPREWEAVEEFQACRRDALAFAAMLRRQAASGDVRVWQVAMFVHESKDCGGPLTHEEAALVAQIVHRSLAASTRAMTYRLRAIGDLIAPWEP